MGGAFRGPLVFLPFFFRGFLDARCVFRPGHLWVPKTSSTSCDQAVFVDRADDAGLSPDAVLVKIDRFGQRFQRRGAVQ